MTMPPKGAKLGRQPPHPGLVVPRLADHRRAAPAPPPNAVRPPIVAGGWVLGRNDSVGDCTVVACANAILLWTARRGAPYRVGDDAILARYAEISGYRPDQPGSDLGAVATDVLGAWSRHGWPVGRQTADVTLWAAVDPRDHAAVRAAIATFGGVYCGLMLPISAQTQTNWTVASGPDDRAGSWGGHAVFVVGYDAAGATCISWGRPLRLSWAFWDAYCDECHALLDRNDWLDTGGHAGAYDFDALAAALAAL